MLARSVAPAVPDHQELIENSSCTCPHRTRGLKHGRLHVSVPVVVAASVSASGSTAETAGVEVTHVSQDPDSASVVVAAFVVPMVSLPVVLSVGSVSLSSSK